MLKGYLLKRCYYTVLAISKFRLVWWVSRLWEEGEEAVSERERERERERSER